MEIKVKGLGDDDQYDERNLVRCPCGKHYRPSKKMFAEFLENYRDIDGVAQIWSSEAAGEVEIHVTLRFRTEPENQGVDVSEEDREKINK